MNPENKNKVLSDSEVIEYLFRECERVGNGITELFKQGEKILTLGATVIIAGIAYGTEKDIKSLFLILPFAVFALCFYGIHLAREMFSQGGYKRYLEEEINSRIGEDILLWEIHIAKNTGHGHWWEPLPYQYFVYVFFLLYTVRKSWITALNFYSSKVVWELGILQIVITMALIIDIVVMKRAHNKAYQLAKNYQSPYEESNSLSQTKSDGQSTTSNMSLESVE